MYFQGSIPVGSYPLELYLYALTLYVLLGRDLLRYTYMHVGAPIPVYHSVFAVFIQAVIEVALPCWYEQKILEHALFWVRMERRQYWWQRQRQRSLSAVSLCAPPVPPAALIAASAPPAQARAPTPTQTSAAASVPASAPAQASALTPVLADTPHTDPVPTFAKRKRALQRAWQHSQPQLRSQPELCHPSCETAAEQQHTAAMGHRLKRLKLNQPSDADQAAGYLPAFVDGTPSAIANSRATAPVATAKPARPSCNIFESGSRPGDCSTFTTDGQYNTLLHQLHRDRLLRHRNRASVACAGARPNTIVGSSASAAVLARLNPELPLRSHEALRPGGDFADLDEVMIQSADGENCELMSTSQLMID